MVEPRCSNMCYDGSVPLEEESVVLLTLFDDFRIKCKKTRKQIKE